MLFRISSNFPRSRFGRIVRIWTIGGIMSFLAACVASDDLPTTAANFLTGRRCGLAAIAFGRRRRRLRFNGLLRDPITLSFIPENFGRLRKPQSVLHIRIKCSKEIWTLESPFVDSSTMEKGRRTSFEMRKRFGDWIPFETLQFRQSELDVHRIRELSNDKRAESNFHNFRNSQRFIRAFYPAIRSRLTYHLAVYPPFLSRSRKPPGKENQVSPSIIVISF